MGTISPVKLLDSDDAPAVTLSPITALHCENCTTDHPPANTELCFVHSPKPDPLGPRLMFICGDCNITLTNQGCRVMGPNETAAAMRAFIERSERVRALHLEDYPHMGTGGG